MALKTSDVDCFHFFWALHLHAYCMLTKCWLHAEAQYNLGYAYLVTELGQSKHYHFCALVLLKDACPCSCHSSRLMWKYAPPKGLTKIVGNYIYYILLTKTRVLLCAHFVFKRLMALTLLLSLSVCDLRLAMELRRVTNLPQSGFKMRQRVEAAKVHLLTAAAFGNWSNGCSSVNCSNMSKTMDSVEFHYVWYDKGP